MEDGLWLFGVRFENIISIFVLILVLMEDGLWQGEEDVAHEIEKS